MLNAGDKVILKNGDWKNQRLIFKGKGTKVLPIVLVAEKAGNVVLSGSSSLLIDGSWLVVDGLNFKDGYTLAENVITFSEQSENCRLTNTAIVDYNNPEKKVRNSWIVLYGVKNRVDHCYLKGKTHVGTTIGIYVSNTPNYHRIDHNFFADRPPLGRNGGEILRIGTDVWSMHDSFTVVEENIFTHCDGEVEIVSNKSTNNTIRNNLFYESKGGLVLRHGNKANVYDNYFIGNGIEGANGIRIIGEGHRIYNNYFQNLTSAFLIRNAWVNPPLFGYWQVKHAEITGNTIIDCKENFVIGAGKDEKSVLPPITSMIANNLIYTNQSIISWLEKEAEIVFKENVAYGMHDTALPAGIKVLDPKLKRIKYGLYQSENGDISSAGSKKMNEIQKAVFEINGIGVSWMKKPVLFNVGLIK
ncbi:MAG: polysaccharide lyase 6 family protein [Pedobacter sp.]|uniref:polysaccharide lyase 6 family protein n=1 Tax=Pedobacter sp. TaxID=1411316 RepID=UPI003563591D